MFVVVICEVETNICIFSAFYGIALIILLKFGIYYSIRFCSIVLCVVLYCDCSDIMQSKWQRVLLSD